MLDGIAELDPIVSKHGVDLVGDGVDKSLQKAGGGTDVRLTMQLGEGELARAVDGYEQVEFGLIGSHLSDVDMDVADRVSLERLFGLIALNFGQPADAVSLETTVQGRAGEMRNSGLQCVETVVERQQGMLTEGDDHCFLLRGQHCGANDLGTHTSIVCEGPFAPLGDRLRVETIAGG